MDKDTEQWFVRLDSSEVVGMTLEELDLAFATGRIHQDTFVLQVGHKRWQKLGDVAELGTLQTHSDPTQNPAPVPVVQNIPLQNFLPQPVSSSPASSLAAGRARTAAVSELGAPPRPSQLSGNAVKSRAVGASGDAARRAPPATPLRAPQPTALGLGLGNTARPAPAATARPANAPEASQERPKGGIRIPRPSLDDLGASARAVQRAAEDTTAPAAAASVWREIAGALPDAPAPSGPPPAPLTGAPSDVASLQERLEAGASVTITSSFPPAVQPQVASAAVVEAEAAATARALKDSDTGDSDTGVSDTGVSDTGDSAGVEVEIDPSAPWGAARQPALATEQATLHSRHHEIVDETSSLIDENSGLIQQHTELPMPAAPRAASSSPGAAAEDKGWPEALPSPQRWEGVDVDTTSGAWELPHSVARELGQLNVDAAQFRAGPSKLTLLLAAAALLIVGGVVFAMSRQTMDSPATADTQDEPMLEESTHAILPGQPAPSSSAETPSSDTDPEDTTAP